METATDMQIRPSPNWTFGAEEPQELDVEAYYQEVMANSVPAVNDLDEERERVARLIRERVERMDPVFWGAHPRAGNRTVRYTFVEHPQGRLWLTLRWWSGGEYGYYFDLVDLQTHAVLKPPSHLQVRCEDDGDFVILHTIEEEARRARGLELLNGSGEERFVVPHGSLLRFLQIERNRATGKMEEQVVAEVLAPVDPLYHRLLPEGIHRYHPVSPFDP